MKWSVVSSWILAVLSAFAVTLQARAGGGAGYVDETFQPSYIASPDVVSVLPTKDGQVYVGGHTGIMVGDRVRSLIRLNANGSVDTSFVAGGDQSIGEPLSLAVDSQGRVIVGARIYRSDLGTMEHVVWRLSPTGAVDPALGRFSVGTTSSNSLSVVRVDAADRIYVGGNFWSIENHPGTLVRLGADGQLDRTFKYGGSIWRITALTLDPEGRLLVGGTGFLLERLLSDGRKDTTFQAPSYGTSAGGIANIFVDQQDRIVIAGPSVRRLLPSGAADPSYSVPGGGIYVTSAAHGPNDTVLYTTGTGVHRLTDSGSPDADFHPPEISGVVALATTADGKGIVGGHFTALDGWARRGVARLNGGFRAIFTFDVTRLDLEEGSGTAQLTVRRIGTTNTHASIDFTVANASAVLGEDYLEFHHRLEFAADEVEMTLSISVVDDLLPEGDEQFSIRMQRTETGAFGTSGTCIVGIPANDTNRTARFAGTYRSLLPFDELTRAMYFSATLTKGGRVTGKLILGDRTLALRGKLISGSLDLSWPAEGALPAVSARFWLDERDGSVRLLAEVTLGTDEPLQFTSFRKTVIKRRAPFEDAGRYTAALAAPVDLDLPQGWSWLLLRVKGNGGIQMIGRLADSTPISGSGWLTDDNSASILARPYKGRGRFGMMVAIGASGPRLIGGIATWSKPATNSETFPGAFEHSGVLLASFWEPEVAFPIDDAPSVIVSVPTLTSLPLSLSGIRPAKLTYGNNELTIDRRTGLLGGRVPGSTSTGRFSGVWLKYWAMGVGASVDGASVPVAVRIEE